MIFIIPWEQFHLKFMNQNPLYVKEDDVSWEIYTYEGLMHIKSIVLKSEDPAWNMMFIERYFAGRKNVVKVDKVISMEEKKVKLETEEEMKEPEEPEEFVELVDDLPEIKGEEK